MPEESENVQRVKMQLTDRGIYEYAAELYSNKLAFIRELFQNASDSGATEFEVIVEKDQITVKDNGNGMSFDFLKNEFNRIGERFKVGNEIGQYGVGRLSVWMLVAEETDSGIKYHGGITITTSNGNERSELKWSKLSEYDLVRKGSASEKGTTVAIRSEDGFPLPTEKEIIDYLSENIVNTNLKIRVNGNEIRPYDSGAAYTVELDKRLMNYRLIESVNYHITGKVVPNSSKVVIAEKGIKVGEAGVPFTGGVMDFDSGGSNSNGIKSLSREGLVISAESVAVAFAEKVLLPYFESLPKEEREKHTKDLLELYGYLSDTFTDAPGDELSKRIERLIVIEGKSIEEWSREKDVAWSPTEKDEWVARARSQGIKVIIAESPALQEMLRNKIPELSEITKNIVPIVLDERGLYEYAKSIYKDRLTLLREWVQNGVDSGATKLNVTVTPKKLVLEDNGKGMSMEFLRNEFNKVGKRFKTGNEIGIYGVGRLTLWEPIINEEKGVVKYLGNITITTSDGRRTTELVWNRIPLYTIHDKGSTTEHGTRIEISYTSKLPVIGNFLSPLPSEKEIINYLNDSIVSISPEIFVNGKKVESRFKALEAVQYKQKLFNAEIGKNASYKFTAGVDKESNRLVVAEKGLKIKEIHLPVGGYVNAIEGKRFGKSVSITTLNREDVTVSEDDLVLSFIGNAVIPYFSKLPVEEAEKYNSNLVELFYNEAFENDERRARAIRQQLARQVVIEGKRLGEWRHEKAVWAMKGVNEMTVMAAVEKLGYTVLTVGDERLANILEYAGLPHINTVAGRLGKEVIRGSESQNEYIFLQIAAGITNKLKGIVEGLMAEHNPRTERLRLGIKDIDSILQDSLSKLGRQVNPKDSRTLLHGVPTNIKLKIKSKGVSAGSVVLYIGEIEEPEIEALTQGNKIIFNINNEYIKTAIETQSTEMFIEPIVHEFVHVMGFTAHDEEFVKAYNTVYSRLMIEIARKQKTVTIDTKTGAWSGKEDLATALREAMREGGIVQVSIKNLPKGEHRIHL